MLTNEFFNAADGFVVSAKSSSGRIFTGYFDIDVTDFYIDDSHRQYDATLLCEQFADSLSEVGNTIDIDGSQYRINAVEPDGTGLINLNLLTL